MLKPKEPRKPRYLEDKKFLEERREKLEIALSECQKRRREAQAEIIVEELEPHDTTDISAIRQRQNFGVRNLEECRRTILLIKNALNAIERGNYGKCIDCGKWIPLKRLRAVLWASRCLPCQKEAESVN